MRSKNEVLCAETGRLANQPKHIKPFLLRITYTILSFIKRNKTIKQTPLERNFSDLNY
jgi:hypothetical protein